LIIHEFVQLGDVLRFDISIWVGVTVSDDDNNLLSTRLFVFLNVAENGHETFVQETSFVVSLEFVKSFSELRVAKILVKSDVDDRFLGVSDNWKPGMFTDFVVVVNTSGDKVDSEFHFVPGVSDTRGGIEKDDVVDLARIFFFSTITFALAIVRLKPSWGEG
jgi:hypothetical protein